MAMEKHISLEDFSAVNGSVNSYGDGSVMLDNVEQEAAEKISLKELELARLKEALHRYHMGWMKMNRPGP
ncbi:hypothetical protein LWI29_005661 [Acer saccharum]|uniref:Uncharacterized protein n=1 Tax=Acer saccharum TaxID=4024 RepID=A0AA39RQY2_ACESA|nr:hypothetical protein LWI29_005661 [Acer saccharum]